MTNNIKKDIQKILERYKEDDNYSCYLKMDLIERLSKEDDFFVLVQRSINNRNSNVQKKLTDFKTLLKQLDFRFKNAEWESKDKKKRVYFDPKVDIERIEKILEE